MIDTKVQRQNGQFSRSRPDPDPKCSHQRMQLDNGLEREVVGFAPCGLLLAQAEVGGDPQIFDTQGYWQSTTLELVQGSSLGTSLSKANTGLGINASSRIRPPFQSRQGTNGAAVLGTDLAPKPTRRQFSFFWMLHQFPHLSLLVLPE